MSGLYLPGMGIPKTGRYFVAVDNTDGKDKTVISVMSEFERGDKTRPLLAVCEIIPVHDHGRLIDGDALMKKAIPLSFSVQKWVQEVDIACAPTIIPASQVEVDNGT